ncbi:MAG: alanine--tRNA ligase [Nitrospirae bacterium]|nr:alanine--tRNA ligase [Nitrospirota bacterium]
MNSGEIRKTFLEYFKSKGHEIVRSSSVVPGNDATLLFTNAGMVQFKGVFQGEEKRPYSRATTSQKCMRAGGKHNDLENVGHTARHHTFFEMLGNFSFGDYFKKDAILFAWELLTEYYKLPKDRLWATVFEDDDEAETLWKDLTGIPANRIVRLGAKDNFWQMGDTGPCGPCSEILIDQGEHVGCRRPDCAVGCDCDRFLEIWNLVFMQFDRQQDGKLNPLPKPSIDTGMGLERLSAVLQGKYNNFDTDLFSHIIAAICRHSGRSYNADRLTDIAIRVIADHIRSITFLLSEGCVPSNEGRGYVLRRIIRRASRYAKSLDISEPVLYRLSDAVAETMGDIYPELNEEKFRVQKMLRLEEERFMKTLEQGLLILNDVIKQTQKGGLSSIPGGELFRLYDTYGFPLDIARDVASEHDLSIDEPGFHREMEQQKTKARASWVGEEASSSASAYKELLRKQKATEFVGYEAFDAEAEVLAVISGGTSVDELTPGSEGEVLLDRTPFYAESGGQIGDTGQLSADHVRMLVLDTRKPVEGMHIHKIRVVEGSLRTGMKVRGSVDRQRRLSIMRNHTATHLLHAALRNVAGEHVKQAGSFVSDERIRFDFTHFQSLDAKMIEAIEDEVNESILRNIPLDMRTMETGKAIESGVTALFGEKYGDVVRVISVPEVSSELCGGTHAHATGDIGLFKIISEGSVAAGIRRIEAVTGKAAIAFFREEETELRRVCEGLKVSERPADRISKVLGEMKEMEKELESLKGKSAAARSGEIVKTARNIKGVKAVAYRLDGLDARDLRIIADNVRDELGSGILVMASVKDDQQASMVAMVTTDLSKRFSAGTILREIAAAAGGKGGGKADTAQGGTKEIALLDKALESLYDILNRT